MDVNWPMGPEDGIPEDDVKAMAPDRQSFFMPWPKDTEGCIVKISLEARDAILKLVEMDRTSMEAHGGLQRILGMSWDHLRALHDLAAQLRG